MAVQTRARAAKAGVTVTEPSSNGKSTAGTSASLLQQLASLLVWVGIVSLPVFFTLGDLYATVFPQAWYERASADESPKPLGLLLGLTTVAVGQVWVIVYHWLHRNGYFGHVMPIQIVGAPTYDFREGMITHLSQPEGFILLGGYLSGTWMMSLMPESYYSFDGGVDWARVLACLLIQDFVQFIMHVLEHKASPEIYKLSHKPHHRFTNPKLFDAYNGSLADTLLMILIPLYCTANLVHCNVWTYMAFGSAYANWLTLIHSEYPHPWDHAFAAIGFGTPADHHVHHKLFVFNFAHLFMYWDRVFGTHRYPHDVKAFNKGI